MTLKDVLQAAALSTVIIIVCIFAFDIPIGAADPVKKSSLSLTELLVTQVAEDKATLLTIQMRERKEKLKQREKQRRAKPVVAIRP